MVETNLNDTSSTGAVHPQISLEALKSALEATTATTGSTKFELPLFFKDNVKLWFAQIENKLEHCKIMGEKARFLSVSSALPPQVAMIVSDLIFNAPTENPYTALKTRIIDEFESTETEKTRNLLQRCTLGDRKPSALLRELRQNAAHKVKDEFLMEIFLDRLPAEVARTLRALQVTDLDKAAAAADSALPEPTSSINTMGEIHGIKKPYQPSTITPAPELLLIQQQILALTEAVNKLATAQEKRSREGNQNYSRDRSRSRSRSRINPRTGKPYDYCYYHYRFGAAAKKCDPPCKFTQDNGNTSKEN